MMKCLSFLTVLFFTSVCRLHALEVPPGGRDVSREAALEAWASKAVGKAEALKLGRRITITRADAGTAYSAQFTALVDEGIAKDERVLAIIKARVVGTAVSGEVQAKLQLHKAPYTSFGESVGVDIHRDWTEQPVTFVSGEAIPAGTAAVVLLCGHKEQSIEVESIRVLKYPDTTDVSSFPRAKMAKRTYPGREPDAPWRKAALERIEQHRKADLTMIVMGNDGKPAANTEVKLNLHRHAFEFGSAVVAKRFSGETEDDKRYREIIDRLFSIVVFENDLKDGNWPPDFDAKRKAQRNAELDRGLCLARGAPHSCAGSLPDAGGHTVSISMTSKTARSFVSARSRV
jgi:endo-1,4-beta-xylanase